jgi:cytochrome c biogenesis protein CcdA/thiol-disulfide isomerase/thioredoxin
MIQIFFAVLAGILTIGAPCILPLLPILLGTSVGQTSRSRPLYIIAGFIIAFAAVGISLSFLTAHLGLDPNTLRYAAIVLLGIFGLLMIWPKPFELLTMRINSIINKASKAGNTRQDNLGGFILGMTLGVIWTPCAGPVLGAILTLVATQNNQARAAVLLLAYAVGAGIPMLIIAYGSQYVTTKVRGIAKYSVRLQQIFGVLIILLGFAMYRNYDIAIENKLAALFPSTTSLETRLTRERPGTGTEKVNFQNYGQAPEFTGIYHWLNSSPLTIKGLKGKVVLVDFWTYSCINCIRTLPYVTRWYDTYKNQGLVIVGVHTPEFSFEKNTNNVADAIHRFNIHYPVAQDNEYATWNAYNNKYWPAEYLIDKNGNIVYEHSGEGNYDHTENTIRELLGIGVNPNARTSTLGDIQSPEMYFGTDRLEYLTPDQSPSASAKRYKLSSQLALNNFALEGTWRFANDHMVLLRSNGLIKLHFSSGKLFIVADSRGKPTTLKIRVDGKQRPDVTVGTSQLYTLFDSDDYSDHTAEIQIPDAGFEAFTFTFG